MTLLVFLIACGTGAVLGLADRPSGRVARIAGLVSLFVAFAAALFVGPTTTATIGDVVLRGSEYAGLFLACATGSALLLCVVALASEWPDEFAPAALAAFAGLAVAMTATDSTVALVAGAAAGTSGALVIARTTPAGSEADGRLAEMRTVGLVAVGLVFAAIAILRPPWNGGGGSPVIVVAFAGLSLALAVRSGAVPFHVPASRLGNSAVPFAPALLLVWIPAGLALLAISWSASTLGIHSDWLGAAVAAVQVVAVATLVLGALAALVHDELEEVAAYSIVADSGFVLLALAAHSDAASEPARLWLLAFVVAKTGLVAWTAAVSRAFGTSNLFQMRGWLRRTPLLGPGLVVIVIATLGWPGSAVYEARSTLIRLALPGQLGFLLVGSILLSLAYFGRVLVVGVLSPTEDVRVARSERPRWAVGTPKTTIDAAVAVPGEATPAARLTPAGGPTSSASPAVVAGNLTTDPGAAGEPGATLDFRERLAGAWRLNRTLEVSLVVMGGAVLAVELAFGGFGATNASRFGIPLDTAAHATPTRTPEPTSVSTTTPPPTLAPGTTLGPSTSAGPSSSGGPSGSALPPSSPAPVKTSAPARPITR